MVLLPQIKLSLCICIPYMCTIYMWQDITYIMEIIFKRFSTINYLLKLTVEEFKHKITKRSSIDIAMWEDVYHGFIRLVHYRFPKKIAAVLSVRVKVFFYDDFTRSISFWLQTTRMTLHLHLFISRKRISTGAVARRGEGVDLFKHRDRFWTCRLVGSVVALPRVHCARVYVGMGGSHGVFQGWTTEQ